jgi:hypothetical protein
MMKPEGLKYIFYACSFFLLCLMLLLSSSAGISCDEVLHNGQSEAVYDYFASHGKDQSALNTPGTHLKYYGQSVDNIATIFARWFNIEDIYSFRHLLSSIAGWITIFITALFAIWLSGYRTGIIVLLLFSVSPVFLGHSQNNLKDVPFALSYIAGTFFLIRMIFRDREFHAGDIILVILSIALSISIRSGGIILICYMFMFLIVRIIREVVRYRYFSAREEVRRLLIIIMVSGTAFFLGIILWPFALQSPVINVMESYRLMAHFPSTFRQLFEGQMMWSDLMPWYYLPKSMVITIPVLVTSGFILFFLRARKIITSGRAVEFSLVFFTVLFPVCFVLFEKSNLYSSWRQFLFIYPAIILLSAFGIDYLFNSFKGRILKLLLVLLFIALAIHPVLFMAKNPRYIYLYYNQLTGGVRGAYGNYETDYYYVSQTEASEWLLDHLKKNNIDSAVVAATSPADWLFRKYPGIKVKYIRNEERSMADWDYAIIANRYIMPAKLKNNMWPPANTIHTVYADGIPLCAVLQRRTKADYEGYTALEDGDSRKAVTLFEGALKTDDGDEMIFYNFARALYNEGLYRQADSALKKGLELNPDFEPILMYQGNIAVFRKDTVEAINYYKSVIKANRKYFQAYVEAARLLTGTDIDKARVMLKDCLSIYPGYKPAITALADTYRTTNPEIARKYDEIASTIK